MAVGNWWQRPILRTDEDEDRERKASWLELFFDLVFVAVVAELAHGLAEHVDGPGLLTFVLLFIPAWWAWIGVTFYTDRFETEDVSYRLFIFLEMLAVAAMALAAHDGLADGAWKFVLAYVAARIVLIIFWLRGGLHNPIARPVTNRYAIGFSISVALWLLSLAVPPPWRIGLRALGLLIDLATPLATIEHQRRLPRLSTSHLPERYGLFVIIVLGESVIAAIAGVAEGPALTLATGLAGACGLTLAFSLWWLYFDFATGRPLRPSPWWRVVWTYAHMPLVMGLTAAGAGVLKVLADEGAGVATEARWLLCGALAVSLLSLALIEATFAPAGPKAVGRPWARALRLLAAAWALLIGALGGGLGALPLLALLLLPQLLQMLQGLYVWFSAAPRRLGSDASAAEAD